MLPVIQPCRLPRAAHQTKTASARPRAGVVLRWAKGGEGFSKGRFQPLVITEALTSFV
jgi:hypothetical protein